MNQRARRFHAAATILGLAVAAISLYLGVFQALRPEHGEDLMTIRNWEVQWLLEGVNPYIQRHSDADYPPHAIVLLSAFSLAEPANLVRIWIFVQLMLAPLAVCLAVKAVNPSLAREHLLLPVVMFLSWSSVRISLWTGQATLLVLVCGLASVLMCRRRPVFGGVLLGLALMKPHIGAPFLIWAVLARQAVALRVAAAFVLSGLLVFVLRIRGDAVGVMASYWKVLTTLFVGEERLVDESALGFRPVMHALIDHSWLADTLHVLVMAALLVWLCRLVLSARRELGGSFDIVLVAVLLVWALAASYSQPYNRMLVLPGVMWLTFGHRPQASWRHGLAIAALQCCLILTFAWGWSDQFTLQLRMRVWPNEPDWLSLVLPHASRVTVLAVLVWLILRVRRLKSMGPSILPA